MIMPTIRKDRAELVTNNELSESAAAHRLGVCVATLAAWRRNNFSRQPMTPVFRRIHKRLIAYTAASVDSLYAAINEDPQTA